jgi:hypothetical protein
MSKIKTKAKRKVKSGEKVIGYAMLPADFTQTINTNLGQSGDIFKTTGDLLTEVDQDEFKDGDLICKLVVVGKVKKAATEIVSI